MTVWPACLGAPYHCLVSACGSSNEGVALLRLCQVCAQALREFLSAQEMLRTPLSRQAVVVLQSKGSRMHMVLEPRCGPVSYCML